jgi:hypothetical protein
MAGRERPRRIDRRTAEYHNLRALQVDTNDDVPDRIVAGWRIGGSYYTPEGFLRGTRGSAEYIVTRPEGYTPYQSVVQPDGRYAYDPNQVQYPRRSYEEVNHDRAALHPSARQVEFIANRSDHYVHRPDQAVRMGIDYDQIRTQPAPAGALLPPGSGHMGVQQPMLDQYGRPVLQGPSPDPRHGYGGSHSGQRCCFG